MMHWLTNGVHILACKSLNMQVEHFNNYVFFFNRLYVIFTLNIIILIQGFQTVSGLYHMLLYSQTIFYQLEACRLSYLIQFSISEKFPTCIVLQSVSGISYLCIF